MENKAFQALLAQIDDLTDEQRATFNKVLDENNDFEKVAMLLDSRLLANRECLYCKSSNAKKWGRQSGLQRMRCFDCGKSFNALTGTPLAHLRKKEKWLKMAAALKDGLTVKDTAEKCSSCISTAFRWRHRFLKAMKGDVAERLEGITEADETYFLESHKGSRNISRKARKRGGKATKRVCPMSKFLFWLREIVLGALLMLFCLVSPRSRLKSCLVERLAKKTFFASTAEMHIRDSRAKDIFRVKSFPRASMSMNAILSFTFRMRAAIIAASRIGCRHLTGSPRNIFQTTLDGDACLRNQNLS